MFTSMIPEEGESDDSVFRMRYEVGYLTELSAITDGRIGGWFRMEMV